MTFNPFSWFKPQIIEDDVLLLIAKIRAGLAIVVADIKAVLNWIDANAGTIVADLEAILALLTKLGGGANPELAALVAAANAAVVALNAYADSRAKGGSQASAVVDGYLAINKAKELHAQLGQAIANADYEPVAAQPPSPDKAQGLVAPSDVAVRMVPRGK